MIAFEDVLVVADETWARVLPQPEPPALERDWYWLCPDQYYQNIRLCAPCPAVVRFGNLNNSLYSHSVSLTAEWQKFLFDLLSLSEYGRHYWEFGRRSDEFIHINAAYEGTYGDRVAFCNRQGYGPPRRNWIAGSDLDADDPGFDQIRGCATNSYAGEIVLNERGQRMLKLVSFDWAAGPPRDYGLEIFERPELQVATIQNPGGAVSKFPRLDGDVWTALITKEPVYCEAYKFQPYRGRRWKPYYR